MTLESLLSALKGAKVSLSLKGGELSVKAPKGALTAELKAAMVSHKAELLKALQAQVQDLPRVDKASVPLTRTQYGIWLAHNLDASQASAYNMPAAVEIRGELNEAALRRAMQALVALNPVLNSHIAQQGDEVNLVRNNSEFPLDALHKVNKSDLQAHIDDFLGQPFDLAAGPLLRTRLIELSKAEHVLLVVVHHIVADGHSVNVLKQQLCDLYQQYCDAPDQAAPKPGQWGFENYALWCHQQDTSARLNYWTNELNDAPQCLSLPFKQLNEASQSRPVQRRLSLSPEQSLEIRTFARQQGCTTNMLMLSAFHLLLGKLSGSRDVVVGVPGIHRPFQALEDAVGLFLDVMPIRMRWQDDTSVEDLLGQCRSGMTEAFRNTGIAFHDLIAELKLARDKHHPIFQCFFNFLSQGSRDWHFGAAATTDLEVPIVANKFDLTFYVEDKESLQLIAQFDESRYSASHVEIWLQQYRQLLTLMCSQGQARIGEVSLLSLAPALSEGPLLPDESLIRPQEQLLSWAERQPDAIAVQAGEKSYTYRDLAADVQHKAEELSHSGLDRGCVAIIARRSYELVVHMYACLQSQRPFFLLNPDYPADKLKRLIAQAGAETVIDLAGKLSSGDGQSARRYKDVTDIRLQDASLAYLAATSGSSAQAKIVLGRWQAIANYTRWTRRYFEIQPGTVCAMLSNVGHDPLLRDVFSCLGNGATLAIADKVQSAEQLADYLKQNRIRVAGMSPALARLLTTVDGARELPALRDLWLVGESLSSSQAAELLKQLKDTRLHNLYGATETQQMLSVYSVCSQEQLRWSNCPVGRSLDGGELLVLNGNTAAGTGELGEVVFVSPYLSLGYLADDADSSADNNAFFAYRGIPAYRTGDLGYLDEQGVLHLQGRKDSQIQIRGFRVEPQEIIATLELLEGVKDAVILAADDTQEGLVACLASSRAIEFAELLNHCQTYLPQYMCPVALICLDELPRTAHGKIDREKLRQLQQQTTTALIPPAGKLEQEIAGIFAEVLNTRVCCRLHFYAQGGHSLAALQIISLLKARLDLSVSIEQFITLGCVADLAGYFEQQPQLEADESQPVIMAEPESRFEPMAFTVMQEGLQVSREFKQGSAAAGGFSYLEVDVSNMAIERLQQVLNILIRRHDMLRVIELPDQRFAVLDDVEEFIIKVHDLSTLPQAEREAQHALLRRKISTQSMDWTRWPSFKAELFCLDGREQRLALCFSHMFIDHRSGQILAQEMFDLYRNPEQLPAPLQLSFRDVARARMQQKQTAKYRDDKAYWLAQIPEMPFSPQLPLAGNADTNSHDSKVLKGRLEKAKWHRLVRLAGMQGCSASAFLLECLCQVLSAWSENSQFTLSLLINDRPAAPQEIEKLVGNFSSLLLYSHLPQPYQTFNARLNIAQRTLSDNMAHRSFEGLEVLHEFNRIRKCNQTLPVTFTSLLNSQVGAIKDPVRYRHVDNVDHLGLECVFQETPDGLEFRWHEKQGLFKFSSQLMLDAMLGFLEHLALPDTDWHAWQPLSCAGENRLAFNQTYQPLPEGLLHQPLVEQALAEPEKTAIVQGQTRITYGQLLMMADQLAGELRAAQVQNNELVAVHMSKSWQQVVAVLAIHLAGAAYLPIDSSLPLARRRQLLVQGEVRVALVSEEDAALTDVRQLKVASTPVTDYTLARPGQSPVSGDDLAYVLFTSGSTGTPKGVMIRHEAARNTIEDINKRFAVGSSDAVLGISSLSFDLSVYDIFGVLATGAKLVLPLAEQNRDPGAWSRLLADEQVSLWNSVPALMQMYLDHNDGEIAPDLRLCMLSGDWIGLKLAKQILEQPHVSLISLGGATEASIWSIYYPVTQIQSQWHSIPYGRPLANQGYFVLNDQMQDCPDGIKGDLYISGQGLADGYWKDEQRSAQSFIYCPGRKMRLYKTGDKGCFLANGNIEFLGREDSQIKLHGYRIELGEIEARLLDSPEVSAAVVDVRSNKDHKQLVAYLVTEARENAVPNPDLLTALDQALSESLPPYMLPQEYAALASLPLTANGKVDRSVLADLATTPRPIRQETTLVDAGQDDEVAIAVKAAIGRLLKLPVVAPDASFAAQGGDSIQAVRLSNQLRKQGINLELVTIFNAADVATLCRKAVRLQQGEKVSLEASKIALDGHPEFSGFSHAIAATPMQRAMLLHTQMDATAYVNQILLDIDSGFDKTALEQAWTALAQRHPILTTRFGVLEEQGVVQLLGAKSEVQICEHDLTGMPDARSQVEEQRNRMKHFADGCYGAALLRFDVFYLGHDEAVLVFTFHHALLDGWSLPLLFAELLSLYRSSESQALAQAPQFADYVAWLERQEAETANNYWRDQLSGFTAPTRLLPAQVTDAPGSILELPQLLDESLTTQLNQLAQAANVTLGVLIRLAWARTLQRLSGQQQVLFGAVSSGRPPEVDGIDSMLGLFLVSLPVTFGAEHEASVAEVLRDMFAQQLESERHGWLSLAEIQKQSEIAPASALFESIVVMENYPLDGLLQHNDGLSIRDISVFSDTHFELALVVTPGQRLKLTLQYQSALLETQAATNIFAQFKRILHELAQAELNQPVLEICGGSIEDKKVQQQWLAGAQGTFPVEDVLEQIQLRAFERGQQLALQCARHQLTYQQLASSVGQLAGFFRDQGISAGSPVVVCLPRGCDVVVTMLSLWQLGAVYVPVDAKMPAQRIANVISQSSPVVVLCDAQTAHLCPPSVTQLLLPELSCDTSPGQLKVARGAGYQLFTSGTTGQPKGVCVDYLALGAFLAAAQQRLQCTADTRVLSVTTPTFDISLLEWLAPLLAGGCVTVASADEVQDGKKLAVLVSEQQINWLQMTPTGWQVLLASGWQGEAGMTALTGGEPLTEALAGQLLAKCARVFNCYGPTEATVWSMIGQVSELDLGKEIELTGPLSQSAHLVLDDNLQSVPVGGTGELWIAGGSLACGYLNDDKQTQQRFVEIDCGLATPVRAYRTGDLVRLSSGHSLRYLGRNDQQIKLNGFRVELQEIEQEIGNGIDLDAVVCLLAENEAGQSSLVAFVVGADEQGIEQAKQHLQNRLPHYMQPANWLLLDALPTHPSGKVNRAALLESFTLRAGHEQADSELEEKLVAIWEKVFEHAPISVTAGFFEIGGNSLLATRLSVLCEEELNNITLDVKQLLAGASIRTIAWTLEPSYLVSKNRTAALAAEDLEEFEWQ
ncbi:amino acid adenylation domain-containing protein [Microbulbifer sp. ANSA003]|uniref:amino acid adenylation domain-containing protein n=1 Tax=Microbulbifer sp. ANSA003 TaxID=3243360 RepID=UPI0040437211